ncbi:hypothetical protein E2562_035749 [Oryza meyeriana var. granulata]|uniref:Uncharacterized protein n=1 Tax=Oryza meyeriana var. granulata TaxID=110450 RepID=A0A6G1FFQ1_9ORYZ|nr:hypothetical protein E2562_035749 [Oryza meyeriana var. granulata]
MWSSTGHHSPGGNDMSQCHGRGPVQALPGGDMWTTLGVLNGSAARGGPDSRLGVGLGRWRQAQ